VTDRSRIISLARLLIGVHTAWQAGYALAATNGISMANIDFYDRHVGQKLREFVEGNRRVERAAWLIERHAPAAPRRILEIGSGVGDITWRVARRWPEAEVIGLDTSPRSVAVAGQIFRAPNLRFVCQRLVPGALDPGIDLAIMLDVYEHIAPGEREIFHDALAEVLVPGGRLVVSCPTPHHQAYLRRADPAGLQPIDEDISPWEIIRLGEAIGLPLVSYEEITVWNAGDYLHAAYGGRDGSAEARPSVAHVRWLRRVLAAMRRSRVLAAVSLAERRALIRDAIGWDRYRELTTPVSDQG